MVVEEMVHGGEGSIYTAVKEVIDGDRGRCLYMMAEEEDSN